MPESGDQREQAEGSESPAGDAVGEQVNDPLMRGDVDAPRAPFQAQPESEE